MLVFVAIQQYQSIRDMTLSTLFNACKNVNNAQHTIAKKSLTKKGIDVRLFCFFVEVLFFH